MMKDIEGMTVHPRADGSYTVSVETLFDSDLAEFEECLKEREKKENEH